MINRARKNYEEQGFGSLMFSINPSPSKAPRKLQNNTRFAPIVPVYAALTATALVLVGPVPFAHAQYSETETNNTKATANVLNLGTATSATISGTSATSADPDYFRINTSYTTAGIYRNQLQLANGTQNIGRIRGLTQTSGVVNAGTDVAFQTSPSNSTPSPYGFDQYYSFGGAGKTQSVYYSVAGAGASTGGAYTATFSSSVITPTFIGSFSQSTINFDALANLGGTTGTTETDTSIIVLDSNYNVYYDNRPSSTTFGYAATNNNPASGGNGFNLNRYFNPGDYYFAVGISTLATNDAAAPDDVTRSLPVLDFDNVIATGNTFYNGNNGATRPADFQITDGYGKTYTSSAQVIPSLYALNFYKFTVIATPEPGSIVLLLAGGGPAGLFLLKQSRRRKQG